MLGALATPVSAVPGTKSYDSNDTESKLLEMGFTLEQLVMLTPEFQEHLVTTVYEEGGKLVSFETDTGDFGIAEGDFQIQGLIPAHKFTISTVAIEKPNPPNGQQHFYVASNWQWLVNPVWKMSDRVGLAWSGTLEADQSSLNSYYVTSNPYGCGFTFRQTAPQFQSPGSGFGYVIDIRTSYGSCTGLDQHSGWIEGTIYKYVHNSQQWAGTVVSKYYHQELCFAGGSLGFDKDGPSISINGTLCYNESNQPGANFTYKGDK